MHEPIFIVGAPRSGTTLTARILGNHSRIFMPGETHFFEDIYARQEEFGDPRNPEVAKKLTEQLSTLYAKLHEPFDQQRVQQLLSQPAIRTYLNAPYDNYGEVLSRFMEIQMREQGKVRWGNHVPRDLFCIESIQKFYPSARIIACVRDVRDFLVSYKQKWRATSQENVARLKTLYHPVVTSLLWKASIKRISGLPDILPQQQVFIFRYEDLVSDPERMTRRICEFLNESFEENMLNILNSNTSSASIYEKGIYTSSVGRFRNGLSNEEVFLAQVICRQQMERYGYQRTIVNVNLLRIALILCMTPFALSRALYVNRKKYGPLIPYLARRLNILFAKTQ